MTRWLALTVGLAIGVVGSGIAVGVLIPQLPDAWRTERLIWGASLAFIVVSLGLAFVVSRPRHS